MEQKIDPDEIVEEYWQADFTREDLPGGAPCVRFTITSENLYRAYLDMIDGPRDSETENSPRRIALCLGIKKTGCIAWTEDPLYRYRDLDMKGRIRLDPKGGYAAAGFIFRMVDDRTYYMALVSSRGYFRLDLVRNGTPLALAGWTEAPGIPSAGLGLDSAEFPGSLDFEMELIACGNGILLLINGCWAGEWKDPSLSEGRICFAAASYEPPNTIQSGESLPSGEFAAEAALLSLTLDSRTVETGEKYETLKDTALPENRVRLAETFAALGLVNPALVQLRKAWESRTSGKDSPAGTGKELLLGARLALALDLREEAEGYTEAALAAGGVEGEARNMQAALFYSRLDYDGMIKWGTGILKNNETLADPASFYHLMGHAYFHTGRYREAAGFYDQAFWPDGQNGLTVKNAGAAYELLGEKNTALDRYLRAGRIFLAEGRYEELGLLLPKFRLLGKSNWEARALTGKWAFGIEDWNNARKDLEAAERMRRKLEDPPAEPDPALYFLLALLLVRRGKRREALPFFEKAARYAPDYPLFRFRLAENRLLLKGNLEDPVLAEDLEAALKVSPEDRETCGWVHNFAAHVALSRGDTEQAHGHLETAAAMLGEIPAVRVNRAVSFYLRGSLEKALKILESKKEEDPEGLMTNCAGNLLVRAGRFEEANDFYRLAAAIAPDNSQYRYNRASCLVELGYYGEADDVLTAGNPKGDPALLELIAFVALKKGEYRRAEAAARAALEMDPDHAPSLLRLGWICAMMGRWEETGDILDRLGGLYLDGEAAKSRDELEVRREEALFRRVACAACGREWKVERNPPPVPAMRLYAAPPNNMPAGTCPSCGKSYCVGCRKKALDKSGRFVCPGCGRTLKLVDEGLKALIHEWAEKYRKDHPEQIPVEKTDDD
ncbi:MAG: tetratricopeptide repeat protein [Treponema sp.]|nr:tetratricopeptide repeat protein [Treponema sp.]